MTSPKNVLLAAAAVAVGIVVALPASAGLVVLTFDTDFNGNPIADATRINDAYPNSGVHFSDNAIVAYSSVGNAESIPNFAWPAPGFWQPIVADFDQVTDYVAAYNIHWSSFTLDAYDIDGVRLGGVYVGAPHAVASVSAPGIARVIIAGLSFGFDNFTFNAPDSVPEPASLAIMGAGLLGLGLLRRRRIL